MNAMISGRSPAGRRSPRLRVSDVVATTLNRPFNQSMFIFEDVCWNHVVRPPLGTVHEPFSWILGSTLELFRVWAINGFICHIAPPRSMSGRGKRWTRIQVASKYGLYPRSRFQALVPLRSSLLRQVRTHTHARSGRLVHRDTVPL